MGRFRCLLNHSGNCQNRKECNKWEYAWQGDLLENCPSPGQALHVYPLLPPFLLCPEKYCEMRWRFNWIHEEIMISLNLLFGVSSYIVTTFVLDFPELPRISSRKSFLNYTQRSVFCTPMTRVFVTMCSFQLLNGYRVQDMLYASFY